MMTSRPPKPITIATSEDVVRARQTGREIARELHFGTADQTRLATAISELTRNALEYAGSGICEITARREADLASISVTVIDQGPGIRELEAAMKDGFSTGGSLGAGLPGTRRLVDDFQIESDAGGTKVVVSMARKIR